MRAGRGWLAAVLAVWLLLSIWRQTADLIGRLWIPVAFNLLQILSCIMGLFAACQRRTCLLAGTAVAAVLSAAYNVVLGLWYIGILGDRNRPVLSAGLPYSYSFYLRFTPACEAHFDLKRSMWVQSQCWIAYQYIEVFQAVLHLLFAAATLVLALVAVCDGKKKKTHAELYKEGTSSRKGVSSSQNSVQYATTAGGRPVQPNLRAPDSINDLSSGYMNSSYDGSADAEVVAEPSGPRTNGGGGILKASRAAPPAPAPKSIASSSSSSGRGSRNGEIPRPRSAYEQIQNAPNPIEEEQPAATTTTSKPNYERRSKKPRKKPSPPSTKEIPAPPPSAAPHHQRSSSMGRITMLPAPPPDTFSTATTAELREARRELDLEDDERRIAEGPSDDLYTQPKRTSRFVKSDQNRRSATRAKALRERAVDVERPSTSSNTTSLVSFDPKSNTLIRVREHQQRDSDDDDPAESESAASDEEEFEVPSPRRSQPLPTSSSSEYARVDRRPRATTNSTTSSFPSQPPLSREMRLDQSSWSPGISLIAATRFATDSQDSVPSTVAPNLPPLRYDQSGSDSGLPSSSPEWPPAPSWSHEDSPPPAKPISYQPNYEAYGLPLASTSQPAPSAPRQQQRSTVFGVGFNSGPIGYEPALHEDLQPTSELYERVHRSGFQVSGPRGGGAVVGHYHSPDALRLMAFDEEPRGAPATVPIINQNSLLV